MNLATLNRDFTKLTAPMSGRIGPPLLDPGNLVVAEKTPLANIVTVDPMRVVFNADECAVLRLRRLLREKKAAAERESELPLACGLADETGFPHLGKLDLMEDHADPKTGTVLCRGTLPNPQGILIPGLFVRVRLRVGGPHKAMLVPEQAIGSDQGREIRVRPGRQKHRPVPPRSDRSVGRRDAGRARGTDAGRRGRHVAATEAAAGDDRHAAAVPGPASPPPAAAPAAGPAAELKAIAGQWKVVQFKKGGNADTSWSFYLEKIDLEKIHFFQFFNEDNFAMLESAQSQAPVLRYAVDPTAKPKTIDVLPGQQGDFIALGIYEIDGDRLKVCLAKYRPALKTDQRPKEFSVGADSNGVLFTLERVKQPATTPAAPRRLPRLP